MYFHLFMESIKLKSNHHIESQAQTSIHFTDQTATLSMETTISLPNPNLGDIVSYIVPNKFIPLRARSSPASL